MAKITDLDVLLPPDLQFKRGDDVYVIPGDLAVETILELFALYAEISEAGAAAKVARDHDTASEINTLLDRIASIKKFSVRVTAIRTVLERLLDERDAAAAARTADDDLREINAKVGAALLRVLQIRQPDLTEIPFGAAGRRIVMQQILANLGVIEMSPAEGDPENPS